MSLEISLKKEDQDNTKNQKINQKKDNRKTLDTKVKEDEERTQYNANRYIRYNPFRFINLCVDDYCRTSSTPGYAYRRDYEYR